MAQLSPAAFSGIYEMLKQRADQAREAPPSTLGLAANAAGKIGAAYAGTKVANSLENDQKKDLLTFQTKLQDELNRNEAKYKVAGEGKTFYTQDMVNQHWAQATGDVSTAPQVGEGIWLKPGEETNLLKHAQFQTEVEKNAQELLASKDPSDQRRGRFLKIISHLPDDKLDSATDDLRKVLVPESSVTGVTSEHGGKGTKSKDLYGRDTLIYPDGTTQVLNGGMPVPPGEKVTTQKQLHPAEADTFKKGLNELDTKALKDSKQSFKDLDKLEMSIKENNPVSFFNNKVELVRLGGISAGRISQGEIVQEAGARDFVNQMQQKLQTLKQGDWTPENKKLILKYIDTLKNIEKEHVQNSVNGAADKTLTSMPNPDRIDPNFIKGEYSKPYKDFLPGFKSADDVKKAVSSGRITKDEGLKILKKDFGFK